MQDVLLSIKDLLSTRLNVKINSISRKRFLKVGEGE